MRLFPSNCVFVRMTLARAHSYTRAHTDEIFRLFYKNTTWEHFAFTVNAFEFNVSHMAVTTTMTTPAYYYHNYRDDTTPQTPLPSRETPFSLIGIWCGGKVLDTLHVSDGVSRAPKTSFAYTANNTVTNSLSLFLRYGSLRFTHRFRSLVRLHITFVSITVACVIDIGMQKWNRI